MLHSTTISYSNSWELQICLGSPQETRNYLDLRRDPYRLLGCWVHSCSTVVQHNICLVHKKVIQPVDELSNWCSCLVKMVKSGNVCICTDISELNKSEKCEHYPILAVEHTLGQLQKQKYLANLMPNLTDTIFSGVVYSHHIHYYIWVIFHTWDHSEAD